VQLTAFEVWLDFGSTSTRAARSKPLELPIVLQVRVHTNFTPPPPPPELAQPQSALGRAISEGSPRIAHGPAAGPQVLLSQVHRLRALLLLARFLDMGSWAVGPRPPPRKRGACAYAAPRA